METLFVIAFWLFIAWVCWKWFLGGWVDKLGAAKTVKAKLAARQIPDEAYYEMAGEEVARGAIRQGLWVQAMSEALGDEKKASAIYIRLRVQTMRQEAAASIRQAADRQYSGNKLDPIDVEAPEKKIVISCPQCAGKLRVKADRHLDITCPHCRAEFRQKT
jgi:Zn finger protein HypA/HybF involved in hydrogenase expression